MARKIYTDSATGIRTRNAYGPTWAERELRKSDTRPEFPMPDERLVITGRNSGRNGVTMYDATLLRNGIPAPESMRVVITTAAYWSDARECYHVTAWGTSRPLEVLLDIGHQLGYSFDTIAQGRMDR